MVSELQKILVEELKLCNLEQDDIMAVMLVLLDNEEAQWEMVEYLEPLLDNPPSRTEIFCEAVKIAGMVER